MLPSFLSVVCNFISLVLGISLCKSFPPPLSAEEEREYFRRLKEEGDENARALLIEHNLRLVSHIVRKYYGSVQNADELVSIGTLGLIKAIDSFRPELGAKFATYAAKCIQNEILMLFRSQKKLSGEVSINETIDVDRDGNPLTYLDVISSEDTIAEDLDLKTHTEHAISLLRTTLDERERKILVLRYGLSGLAPMTQREVSSLLGISRSYVSRIEKKALATLRACFGDQIPDFDT